MKGYPRKSFNKVVLEMDSLQVKNAAETQKGQYGSGPKKH